jgi:hypothetical protein
MKRKITLADVGVPVALLLLLIGLGIAASTVVVGFADLNAKEEVKEAEERQAALDLVKAKAEWYKNQTRKANNESN